MCIGRGETDKWICLPFWQAPYTEKEKKQFMFLFTIGNDLLINIKENK